MCPFTHTAARSPLWSYRRSGRTGVESFVLIRGDDLAPVAYCPWCFARPSRRRPTQSNCRLARMRAIDYSCSTALCWLARMRELDDSPQHRAHSGTSDPGLKYSTSPSGARSSRGRRFLDRVVDGWSRRCASRCESQLGFRVGGAFGLDCGLGRSGSTADDRPCRGHVHAAR